MNNDCTVYKTMDYLAKKWTIMILLELYKGESWKRFSKIKESMKDITPKVLSERLKELEAEGLIMKRVSATAFPMKSEYALTEMGVDLIDAIKEIKVWALRWKVNNPQCGCMDCRVCVL